MAGYDYRYVNRYISKLFSNVGQLTFEMKEEVDKPTANQIVAVHSSLGETMWLHEVRHMMESGHTQELKVFD